MINATFLGYSPLGGDALALAISLLKQASQDSANRLKEQRHRAACKIRAIKKQALKRAYQSGKEQALQDHAILLLSNHLSYQELIYKANRECLALALSVTEEVLQSRISGDNNHLSTRIQNLLDGLLDQTGINITVNNADYEEVQELLRDQYAHWPIRLKRAAEVAKGNAIILTVSGAIELNWQTHFATIREQLCSRLESLLLERSREQPDASTS